MRKIDKIIMKICMVSIVGIAMCAITTPSAFAYGWGTHDGIGYAAFSHSGLTPSGGHHLDDGQWYFGQPDNWLPLDVTNHYLFPPNYLNIPVLGTAHLKVASDIATYLLPTWLGGGNVDNIRNAMHYTADCGIPFHTTPLGEGHINSAHGDFEGYAQNPSYITIPNYQAITSGDSTYSNIPECVRTLAIETAPQYDWMNNEIHNNPYWRDSGTMDSRTINCLTNTMQHCNSIAYTV